MTQNRSFANESAEQAGEKANMFYNHAISIFTRIMASDDSAPIKLQAAASICGHTTIERKLKEISQNIIFKKIREDGRIKTIEDGAITFIVINAFVVGYTSGRVELLNDDKAACHQFSEISEAVIARYRHLN